MENNNYEEILRLIQSYGDSRENEGYFFRDSHEDKTSKDTSKEFAKEFAKEADKVLLGIKIKLAEL